MASRGWPISLDHHEAGVHDDFRRVPGSYDLTIRAIEAARDNDIPVQINSTVTKRTAADMPRMAESTRPLLRIS